jgi:predicted kinase
MVADDAGAQDATEEAFSLLNHWLDLRLKRRRFTVVDSTALKPSSRDSLLKIAEARHVPVFALVLDVSLKECLRRSVLRTERLVPESAIRRQHAQFDNARREIARDNRFSGYNIVSETEIEGVMIQRGNLTVNSNGFDVIGDVHGCWQELADLWERLGYTWDTKTGLPRHSEGESRSLSAIWQIVVRTVRASCGRSPVWWPRVLPCLRQETMMTSSSGCCAATG